MANIGKCLLAYAAAVLASVAIGAAELPKMIIATGVDPSFAHFYVGVSADILKKNGVDAQLKTGPSGGAMVPLVISDQSNASMAASLPGLVNHLVDPDLVAVAQISVYEHFYGILATKEVKNLQDLKGRKVGITRATASEALWYGALKKFDLPAPFADFVYVEPPEMLAAIERGDIVAFSSWEPWLSRTLLAVPNTQLLMDNHDVFLDAGFIYMNRRWIEKNKDTAVKFIRAMVESTDFIQQKPDETKKIVGDTVNIPPTLMTLIMPKVTYCAKLDRQSYDLIKIQVELLRQRGRVQGDFAYDKFIYPELLKAIDPSRVDLPKAM
jgi:ABC-type nitrate/sulfonate/bicarbonate transport system substrate-binding protein